MRSAGAEDALNIIMDSNPSFDVKICVKVLLRRLTEEGQSQASPPSSQAPQFQANYGMQQGQQQQNPAPKFPGYGQQQQQQQQQYPQQKGGYGPQQGCYQQQGFGPKG